MRTSHGTRILVTQQEVFWIHSFFINHVTMSRAKAGIMWGVSGRACHGEHVGNGARGAVPPDYFPPEPVHVCSEWRNSAPVVPIVVDSGTSLMKDNERVWSFRIAHQQYQLYRLPRKQSAAQAGPRWVFQSCLVTWNLLKLMVTVLKMDAGLEFTFCCSIPCSGFNQWQNRKRGWLLVAVELYVRCSVSLWVYGKHSQSVANRKIAKKMIDLEICLDLNWPMTNRIFG